jgi:hypothetical protein
MKSLNEILNEGILDVDNNIDDVSKTILNKKCKNFEAFVEMIAGYLGVETPKIIKKSEVIYLHREMFVRKTYTDVEIATIEFLRPGEKFKERINILNVYGEYVKKYYPIIYIESRRSPDGRKEYTVPVEFLYDALIYNRRDRGAIYKYGKDNFYNWCEQHSIKEFKKLIELLELFKKS